VLDSLGFRECDRVAEIRAEQGTPSEGAVTVKTTNVSAAVKTNVSAAVTPELRESVVPILRREGLTISEYLRLALVALRDSGKPPFEIPDSKRYRSAAAGGLKEDAAARLGSA
jgi:hypothetical protein